MLLSEVQNSSSLFYATIVYYTVSSIIIAKKKKGGGEKIPFYRAFTLPSLKYLEFWSGFIIYTMCHASATDLHTSGKCISNMYIHVQKCQNRQSFVCTTVSLVIRGF